jgi:hypothetical protein
MKLLDVLLANLDEAYDRKGWHGTTLRGSLRGLRPRQVFWRPAPRRHNIYELTLHAAYWKYAVRQRLAGGKRGSFAIKGSNWFASPKSEDDGAWRDAVALLESEHRALRAVIPSVNLDDPKQVRLIYGIAAHDLYHTGQIQMIKRLRE